MGTKKISIFLKFFWGEEGMGLCFYGDLTYLGKLNYFGGGYFNGKLIYIVKEQLSKKKNNLNSSFKVHQLIKIPIKIIRD